MPDTWTTNPEKLRDTLLELGATCGVEARVLKPRDPEWTCYVDTNNWMRDIYIHPVSNFFSDLIFIYPLIICVLFGMLIGIAFGKRLGVR